MSYAYSMEMNATFAAYIPVYVPQTHLQRAHTEAPRPVGPAPKMQIDSIDVGVLVVSALALVLLSLGSRSR